MFSIIKRNQWVSFPNYKPYDTDFNKHKVNAKQDSPAAFLQPPRRRLRMSMFCPVAEVDMMTPPAGQGTAISGWDPVPPVPLRAGPRTSQL